MNIGRRLLIVGGTTIVHRSTDIFPSYFEILQIFLFLSGCIKRFFCIYIYVIYLIYFT